MDTKERFLRDTENHQLTIIQDEGVYRHMRMGEPGNSCYHYTLTTWPNHLCISGDMGTYVFSRLHDMFDFFQTAELKINTHYWAEKCLSEDKASRGMKEFDREGFVSFVEDSVKEWDFESDDEHAEVLKDILEKIDERVGCESTAYSFISDYESEDGNPEYSFGHIDDFRFERYTANFEWILYAIVRGIQAYEQLKAQSLPDADETETDTPAMR